MYKLSDKLSLKSRYNKIQNLLFSINTVLK
jgi:hypothetical protein